jgi:hypothetical protein
MTHCTNGNCLACIAAEHIEEITKKISSDNRKPTSSEFEEIAFLTTIISVEQMNNTIERTNIMYHLSETL